MTAEPSIGSVEVPTFAPDPAIQSEDPGATVTPIRPNLEVPTDSPSDTAPENPIPEPENRPVTEPVKEEPGLEKFRFVISATKEKGGVLPSDAQELDLRLSKRLQANEAIEGSGQPLSPFEQQIKDRGQELMAKLKTGEISRQDAAFLYKAVYDELLQKIAASGVLAKDVKIVTEFKDHFWSKNPSAVTEELGTDLSTNLGISLTTPYTETALAKFGEWKDEQGMLQDLADLNGLRQRLEQSLFGVNYQDPMFEHLSMTGDVSKIGLGRSIEQNAVWSNAQKILEAEFNGESIQALWAKDPGKALEIVWRANMTGLVQRTTEELREAAALEKLGEKPNIRTVNIRAEIEKAKAEDKPEDIEPLQKIAEEAQAAYDASKSKVQELTTGESGLAQAEIDLASAKSNLALKEARLKAQSDFLKSDSSLADLNTVLTATKQQRDEVEADPELKTAEKKSKLEKLDRLISEITLEQVKLRGAEEEKKLRGEIAVLKETKKAAQTKIDKLKGKGKEGDPGYEEGEISRAEKELDEKKTAKETADDNLKQAQDEIANGGSEKAKMLEMVLTPAGSYSTILSELSGITGSDLYSFKNLTPNLIRQAIFGLKDPGKYNLELAKKIISDETMVQAIKNIYGDTGEADLSEIIKQVHESSQAEATLLVKHLMDKTIRSAEQGEAALNMAEEDLTLKIQESKPEMKANELDSILGEGIGTAQLQEGRIDWEGMAGGMTTRETGQPVDLTTRVSAAFGKEGITLRYARKVDLKLIQTLPEEWEDTLPPRFREYYNNAVPRRLSPDAALARGGWAIYEGTEDGIFLPFDGLENDLQDKNILQQFERSVGTTVLKMTGEQRKAYLSGANALQEVSVAESGVDKAYRLDMDTNGNLSIIDNTGSSLELQAHFNKRIKEVKGESEALTDAQKTELQKEFWTILETLGKETIKGQDLKTKART